MATYTDLLKKIGLDEKEAEVYEALLSLGKAGMRKILNKTSLKRGSAYNAVYGLKDRGLVVELVEGGRKVFELQTPDRLEGVIKASAQSLHEAEQTLQGSLPSLKSAYNLIMHRPNVRFFEGLDGIRKVANDSLEASGEIYSYIDNEAVNKFVPEINKGHIGERQRRGIKKKMITLDSPWLRKNASRYRRPLTEIRVVQAPAEAGFATVMQIYDHKVSYITLDEVVKIGIIIEDEHIARMHRTLFDVTWKKATPLFDLPVVLDDAQA